MKEWFLARGYPKIVVNNQIDKLFLVEINLFRKICSVVFLLLLPITLSLKSLENWLGTYFLFLDSDGKVQKVFSPPPIISYKSTRKIKDYLMRSKLYPVERKVGCGGVVVQGVRFVTA